MTSEVKEFPAMRLAAVRHSGAYMKIGPAFHELGRIAGMTGLFHLPGALMMGIYKDDPRTTPEDELRSAAGIPVPDDAAMPPGLVEERLPAGKYACFMHEGAYDTLGETWMKISTSALADAGYRRRQATAYEIYLNDPSNAEPEDLRTQICIPIE